MNHSFDVEHARLYGMAEAVLISNMEFWIAKNEANGKHEHDGRFWTYNSVQAFSKLFPYLTPKRIRTALENLEANGVLLTGNYNANPRDRTCWYALTDEWILARSHLPSRANASAPRGKSLIEADVNTDIPGFACFWEAWPPHPRKESKGKCLEKWKIHHMEKASAEILAHVEGMKQSDEWKKAGGKYIPAPMTYLNQRRWEGAEPPQASGILSESYL